MNNYHLIVMEYSKMKGAHTYQRQSEYIHRGRHLKVLINNKLINSRNKYTHSMCYQ
jgi:hypothetical protein